MPFVNEVKALLDHRVFRFALVPVVSQLARARRKGVNEVFYDSGVWMHKTRHGYFAYHQPYVRLDMAYMNRVARANFFWGYRPRVGDVIIDVGAGVGEEALTFSRAVGERGKVVCIEAHPRTYRCLEKLVLYNRLKNVIPVHKAVTDTPCGTSMIEDSNAYLRNRSNARKGIPVPAATLDAIYQKLSLSRVHFLKMNIEGAERLAIRGMRETLNQTEALCISCHDFLAEVTGDDAFKTKNTVMRFLQDRGFDIIERSYPGLPPYICDQVWAYNNRLSKN